MDTIKKTADFLITDYSLVAKKFKKKKRSKMGRSKKNRSSNRRRRRGGDDGGRVASDRELEAEGDMVGTFRWRGVRLYLSYFYT